MSDIIKPEVRKRYESFEDALPTIYKLIKQKQYKWILKGITHLDYDDVTQIIVIHVFSKWGQFNNDKGRLESWVNAIISNQLINLGRNIFYNSSRPCLKCACNQGETLCEITKSGLQCAECPIYAKWEKGKKSAFNVKQAVPLPNHELEVHNIPSQEINYDKSIEIFHKEMEKVLNTHEFRIYKMLFIEHLSEEEIAKRLNFKTTGSRAPGYMRIKQIEKIALEKGRELLKEIDLF